MDGPTWHRLGGNAPRSNDYCVENDKNVKIIADRRLSAAQRGLREEVGRDIRALRGPLLPPWQEGQ